MNDSNATLVALTLVAGLVGLITGLAIFLWYAAALSRVFARRNVEPWRAWVPVLNEAEILRLGGRPAWTVVFFFIPVVWVYAIVLRALAAHRIGRTFGRGAGSTVLAVVLPPVWATVLAATREPVAAEERPAPRAEPSEPRPEPVAPAAIVEPPVALAPPAPVAPPVPITPPPDLVAAAPPPEQHVPSAAAPSAEPDADLAPIRTPFMDAPEPAAPEPVVPEPVAPTIAPAEERTDIDIELDDDAAETIVVERAAVVTWTLVTDAGDRHPLEADVVVLGRRPAGEEPGVQYLAVPDTSRTLSKQHACLTRQGDGWIVTDLQSTNGVFLELDGVERQLAPGDSASVSGRLLLGTVGLRIEREDAR
ncbi:DUF5684 domain-containing protein [Leifsonia sp. NPDC058194]|uniref:DUF5684 domain-containing protein n=1 Tax=Leifsonia sp. NPDC058194 TaxID=3346374 RepID=UPI0036D83B1D